MMSTRNSQPVGKFSGSPGPWKAPAARRSIHRELRELVVGYLHRADGDRSRAAEIVHRACDQAGRAKSPRLVRQAASFMRCLLVDQAIDQTGWRQTTGDFGAEETATPVAGQLLAVDRALRRLTGLDPQQAKIVELRYFAGLTFPETAKAMGVPEATVQRQWRIAQLFLHREMSRAEGSSEPAGA